MGSKTPEGHYQGSHGNGSSNDDKPVKTISSSSKHGAGPSDIGRGVIEGDGGGGSDDDDDDGTKTRSFDATGMKADLERPVLASNSKYKKRKRSKKKKNVTGTGRSTQTSPPTVPVATLFPEQSFPHGELIPYENTSRITDEETRHTSRLFSHDFLTDYRHAAEIHRQVRQYVQRDIIKPGVAMSTIASSIEEGIYALTGNLCTHPGDPLRSGPGFPTGLSLNNIAAHWTPNPGSNQILLAESDVLSIDFGVHVNGRIVDSAFTVCFDDTYTPLLDAVRDATNTGVTLAGVDARISEIGSAVQEVMESYEVSIPSRGTGDDDTANVSSRISPPRRVKAVTNITGHNILPFRIHGDKSVPFVRNNSRQIMEEGDVFAIETFGSTGPGVMMDGQGVYGYSRNPETVPSAAAAAAAMRSSGSWSTAARSLLKLIDESFGTIPFSKTFLKRLLGVVEKQQQKQQLQHYHLVMKQLVRAGIVEEYCPLIDVPGSKVAQFEHTVLLHAGGKEVISRGDDY